MEVFFNGKFYFFIKPITISKIIILIFFISFNFKLILYYIYLFLNPSHQELIQLRDVKVCQSMMLRTLFSWIQNAGVLTIIGHFFFLFLSKWDRFQKNYKSGQVVPIWHDFTTSAWSRVKLTRFLLRQPEVVSS